MSIFLIVGIIILVVGIPIGFKNIAGTSKKTGRNRTPRNKA